MQNDATTNVPEPTPKGGWTDYGPAFPPKNRKANDVELVEVHLVDSLGTLKVDLNRAALMGATGTLPLAGPVAKSDISGGPAFWYRAHDGINIALTHDEMLRLLGLSLLPHEYFKLREHLGLFHEIHDDFYDGVTGEALQPRD